MSSPHPPRDEPGTGRSFWILNLPRGHRIEQPLTLRERQILEQARDGGGTSSVAGLSMLEMLQVATLVLELKRRGLVESRIQFSTEIPGQPVAIPVTLTAKGRRSLE